MRNKLLMFGVMSLGVLFLAGCGSSGGTDSGIPTISTIDDLPKATSPMESASANEAVQSAKGFGKVAQTGLNLAGTTADSFTPSSSMAACETFNVLKEGIQSAAQADMILCYVQEMQSRFSGLTDANGAALDVYDGNWHILKLNMAADPESPNKVKMRIVKNSAGSITSFVMFMCKGTDDSLTQSEYTSQTIDGTTLTMTAKGNFVSSEWSGSHQVDVTGTLNSSGLYTQKAITTRNTGSQSGYTNWQEGTLTQTPGGFVVSGYRYGNYRDQMGNQGTSQEAAYGTGELLGDTSASIADLAMGDGAVYSDSVYTQTPSGQEGDTGIWDPDPVVSAWLGDTGLPVDPANGSSFYTAASAGTLPTVQTSPITIAFTDAQTWDCSDDEATAVTLPVMSDGGAAVTNTCSPYGMGGSWINCYQQIPPTQ